MAALNFAEIASPLPGDDPCGPGLDLEGDAAFMNFMAGAESGLPDAYFKTDHNDGLLKPFDRAQYDFKGQLAAIGGLLKRTRDLRLLALAARILALDRDLDGCSRCLDA